MQRKKGPKKKESTQKSLKATPAAKTPSLKLDGSERKQRRSSHLTEDSITAYNIDLSVSYRDDEGDNEDDLCAVGGQTSTTTTAPSEDSQAADVMNVAPLSDAEVSQKIKDFDEVLNAKLDMEIKRFLLSYMELDLIKEVSLERALCKYYAEKRIALKAGPGLKIKFDWAKTVAELARELRNKFDEANARVKLQLQNEQARCSEGRALETIKLRLQAVFLVEKGIKRKINACHHSLLSKIVNHWLVLDDNILLFQHMDPAALRKRVSKAHKSHMMSVMVGSLSGDAPTDGGLCSLLQVMQGSQCDQTKMMHLIEILDDTPVGNSVPATIDIGVEPGQTRIDDFIQDSSTPLAVEEGTSYFGTTVESSGTTDSANKINLGAMQQLRYFLHNLFDGVSGKRDHLCIKLQSKLNAKNKDVIAFLQFLIEHESTAEGDKTVLFRTFKESSFYATMHCNFYIPFKDSDRNLTMSDGYCFTGHALHCF